jgi:hypothetical protein
MPIIFLKEGDPKMMAKSLVLGAVAACLVVTCVNATSSTNAVEGDFAYQGEFLGTAETISPVLGVQVVANGDGKFTAAFLTGGLPGAGWDGTGRVEQPGTLQGGTVTFAPKDSTKEYSATISADGSTLSGKTPEGESFTLNRSSRTSPTLNAPPPSNATVLFDGKDLNAFVAGTAVLDSGLLLPTGSASSGALTKKSFGSFTLHLEFLEPFMPYSTGQSRGNSGVYLQGRYELQILDSFGLNIYRGRPGEETQECGAFYQLAAPKLNMSLPPMTWQTYDVEFTKAKFDTDGKTKLEPAMVTVRLNGVLIHENQKLINNTLLGDSVTAADGPIRFQAHGDPVKYRNIWIVEGTGVAVRSSRSGQRTIHSASLGTPARMKSLLDLNGRRAAAIPGNGLYVPAHAVGARKIVLNK